MNKYSIPSFCAGFTLLVVFISLTGKLGAQQNLEQSFSEFSQAGTAERIYVRTDKDFYLTGEIMWYKAHVRNDSFLPAAHSHILFLEIWNEEKAVLQQKLSLTGAATDGSLYLPLYLGSGKYILRAYTPHLKNHPEEHFERSISIINPFNQQSTSPPQKQKFYTRVLPEGGKMVENLPAKLGLKVTDANGRYVDYQGWLIKNQKDSLASFRSHKFGLSSFSFTPDTTSGFSILLALADTSFQVSLPRIYASGSVMHITNKAENYELNVQRSSSVDMMAGKVLVHTGQRLVLSSMLRFDDNTANLLIPKAELGEGISRVTLFDQDANPIGERLLFKQASEKLPLNLRTNKFLYGTRQKISVAVQSSPTADLSMAVYHLDSLNRIPDNNILAELWLRTDLKGKVDSAGYYFGPLTEERKQAVENLLLTHGWRGFDWQRVLSGKSEKYVLPGQVVKVKVTREATGAPVAGRNVYLSVPGKDFQFYSGQTNNQGMATIVADRLYGSQKVLLVAEEASEANFNYEILDPYYPEKPIKKIEPLYLPPHLQETLKKQSLNMQVQNVYAKEKLNQVEQPRWDGLHFYGTPDMTYLLDNYTRFPTMEEVLREYVREVQVRTRDEAYWLRMFYDVQQRFFLNEPLRLIDGIPVYDSDKIIGFDPLRVEKLEVIDQRFVLGPSFSDGVISFSTYEGDADPEELNTEAFVTRYQGLEQERVFYSPEYQVDSVQRTPDFRSLLHWEPNIQLDEEGKARLEFYTGDRSGTYLIRVEGIDEEGRAAYRDLKFEVTGNQQARAAD